MASPYKVTVIRTMEATVDIIADSPMAASLAAVEQVEEFMPDEWIVTGVDEASPRVHVPKEGTIVFDLRTGEWVDWPVPL